MRITNIEIKNFRAFPSTYQINLNKAGKNLLVYGENGSGKSSLYLALKLFLESSEGAHRFENHQNIFITGDNGHIKLHLRANPGANEHVYEWSQSVEETNDPLIIEASRAKGFLDYKVLLETHYIHREEESVNVFKFLVDNLLINTVNRATNRILGEEWVSLQQTPRPRRNAKTKIAELETEIETFNSGLNSRLEILQTEASEILGRFGYNVALDLDFQGVTYNRDKKTLDNQEILLTVEFFDRDIPEHHRFLNEAKLSAIAIAIYFSSILLQPESELKILALDDVLIGLDMSNRLPVLDLLDEDFADYQIFLTTYDKAWYEIVKQRTSHGGKWKAVEFYFRQTDEYEIPVYVEDKAYLDKATEYLDANDYKACAIYLRTAFEVMIEEFCDTKPLTVRYRQRRDKLHSQDFWDAIKVEDSRSSFLDPLLIRDIELYRSRILNPLSHTTITNIPKKEIEDAIKAVERLKIALQ